MTTTGAIFDFVIDPLVRVIEATDGVGDGIAVVGFALLVGVIVSALAWLIVTILVALNQ